MFCLHEHKCTVYVGGVEARRRPEEGSGSASGILRFYFDLGVCVCVCVSACLSVCLSVSMSLCLCVSASTYVPVSVDM